MMRATYKDGKSAIHVQVNTPGKLWQLGSYVTKLRNLGSRDFACQYIYTSTDLYVTGDVHTVTLYFAGHSPLANNA